MRYLVIGLVVICTAGRQAFGQSTSHLSIQELRQLRLPDVVLEKAEADARKGPPGAGDVQVQGVIGGNIRFELLLPETWNGRLVMGGGGGFVGSVQNAARDSVNRNSKRTRAS